jgi:hypothetical protein
MITKFFAIAVVILAASPVLAQPARHDVLRGAYDQKAASERNPKPRACVPGETCMLNRNLPNAGPDDWQSRLILG